MQAATRLGPDFFNRDTASVAQDLLGKALVRQLDDGTRLAGVIVEVEAYLAQDDPASHSFRGHGKSNASMFGSAGLLYVYPIHAKYCLNVVTEGAGVGAAVLIRALQPIEGIDKMLLHRGTSSLLSLTTGPARLCQALAVNRSLDGTDLVTSSHIWLEQAPATVSAKEWSLRSSPRIGISRAVDRPLRWFVDGHRYVSGCARDHSCRRDWSF